MCCPSNVDLPESESGDEKQRSSDRRPNDHRLVLFEKRPIWVLKPEYSIRKLRDAWGICWIVAILFEASRAELGTGNSWGKLHPSSIHRSTLETFGPIGIWRVRVWLEATDGVRVNLIQE